MITQQEIKELFDYKDGELYWKVKPLRGEIGDLAGHVRKDKRKVVGLKSRYFYTYRLIYLMHFGELPNLIDHIDKNPLNNKIENLRKATKSQNALNSNTKNVSWIKNRKKWKVQANKKHIGYFENLELAELVAIMAKEKYYGGFANHA
jgi:hypothetical protein